jgi:CarD family transcriptional regulator
MKASGTQARSQGVAKGTAAPKQSPRAQSAAVAPTASRSAKAAKEKSAPAQPARTTPAQAAAARAATAMAEAAARAKSAPAGKAAAKPTTKLPAKAAPAHNPAPARKAAPETSSPAKAAPPKPTTTKTGPAKTATATPDRVAPVAPADAVSPRLAPRAKAPSPPSIETQQIVTSTANDLRKPAAKAAPEKAAAIKPAPEKQAEPAPVPPPAPASRPAAPPAMANGRPAPVSRAAAKEEHFVEGDYVVYPTHGVGKVEKIAKEEIAGHHLELIHITFEENRMTLRVPVAKARSAGLRKLATRKMFDEALAVLKGRARIKRTMWSRRAQEYEAKINSGDPTAIAEVVRDLHRNAGQPDQSFSERQIYEAAMDRLAAELAALDQTDKATALAKLGNFLKTL